jgi:hypothetical protein
MSFDIFFFKFSNGEVVDLPRQPVLTILESQVFKDTGDDCYDIHFPDGSHVEFSAGGLSGAKQFDCCVFYIRGMSDAIIRLAFEIAKATGCVMIASMEKGLCILLDASQGAELPVDLKSPMVVCGSPEELGRLIKSGYADWRRYVDHVIQSYGKSNPAT